MGAVESQERPPEWIDALTRPDLRRMFGTATLERGTSYQRRGLVRNLRYGPDGWSVIATVLGTRRYTTVVSAHRLYGRRARALGSAPVKVVDTCSCALGGGCKHAVAVILESQAYAATSTPSSASPWGDAIATLWEADDSAPPWEPDEVTPLPPTPLPPTPLPSARRPTAPAWEQVLTPVLREAPGVSWGAPAGRPLALLFDVTYSPRRAPGGSPTGHLKLRPLVPGQSGGWIRSGVSWSELLFHHNRAVDPAHREALAAIASAERLLTHSYYSSEWVSAGQLGPSLWRLLADAAAAGVELRTGRKAELPVRLLPEAVDLVLDVTRSPDGDAVLRAALDLPEAAGQPAPIGSPAHGVFVTSTRGLLLARLAKSLPPGLAPLVDACASDATSGGLAVPASDLPRFLSRYYPALRQHARVESSDGTVELPTLGPPRLALEVHFEPEHQTRLHWSFRYQVGDESTDVPLIRPQAGQPWTVLRDPAGEEALLSSLGLLDAVPGLRVPIPGKSRLGVVVDPVLSGWGTVAFVRDVLPGLVERPDIDLTVVGTPLEYVEVTERPVVTVSTSDIDAAAPARPEARVAGAGAGAGTGDGGPQADWFDLGISVSFGGREVPLATLLTALAQGEERLLLDDGTWFSLAAPELHALRRIVEEARALQDGESVGLRVSRYQAGLWEELVSLGVVAHQSDRWARSVGGLLALKELPHPEPPGGLDATLRHYQLDGYQWLSFLWDQQLGGILADDMGLGKTLQTLAMAERAREQGGLTPAAPVLVVAPTSVVSAWQREAARFTPKLSVVAVTATTRKSGTPLPETTAGAHLVVTSYALFRIDAEQYTAHPWSALVLDEAQAVKNHQSRTYQVARTLPAPVKLAITGTPLENSLMDLWSLLSIVAPGLFPTPQKFGELYRKPIESGDSPELLTTLRRRIRPLMLRRTKEAVAPELPPKIEQVVAVPLNPAHRRIYDTHLQRERQRILGLLDDVDRNRIAILTALTKLRQLSLDVHLVVPDAPATVHSSKVDALLDQLVEVVAEGHRALVFSQFTGFLRIVRARLAAEGIDHVYLDGRTRDRARRIAEFTDGDAPAFLISLKAGGSGLTLTQADYVFVLDPWWNPAVEAQAVDRTHRIGQDKTVMVYRLVSEGTIEEKVVALQERKRELFARVVDEGGLMGAPLSADDIRGLLDG